MLVVATKGVQKNFDVVLAALAALEVKMLFCLSVFNEFHHFAMSVRNEFIFSHNLMFVIFPCLLLLLRMLWRIMMLFIEIVHTKNAN